MPLSFESRIEELQFNDVKKNDHIEKDGKLHVTVAVDDHIQQEKEDIKSMD